MNQTMTKTSPNAALAQARIAIISANWHTDVVHQARDAATLRLQQLGAAPARIHQVEVPGAFEIPLMAQKLAASGKFDAVIGCAVIVNGGIYHHEFVSAAVVDGLMRVQLDTGVDTPQLPAIRGFAGIFPRALCQKRRGSGRFLCANAGSACSGRCAAGRSSTRLSL